MPTDDTIAREGRREYGDAHRKTGQWIVEHAEELVHIGPASYALIMIHQKAVRGLNIISQSPSAFNADHFVDILGYLELAVHELGHPPVRKVGNPDNPILFGGRLGWWEGEHNV